jgi:hypothetical protein
MTASPATKNTQAATEKRKIFNGGIMSHRFFSSIAGTRIIKISAVTALALGLACGGGNRKTTPDDPLSASTPIIRGPFGGIGIDDGINYHMYTITATSEGAIDWYAPVLPNNSNSTIVKSPGTEAKAGVWQYTPRLLSGDSEVIMFQSKSYSGPDSEPGYLLMNIKENHSPQMPERINEGRIFLTRTVPATIAFLEFKDKDGDQINWQNTIGAFNTMGGKVDIQSPTGLVVFNAAGVPDGAYTTFLTYREVDPRTGATVERPINESTKTIMVVVNPKYSSGRDPHEGPVRNTPNVTVTPPPPGERTVYFGIPSVFTFEATDSANSGNMPMSWAATSNPGQIWIAKTVEDIPDTIGTGSDSVNIKSSKTNTHHPNYDKFVSNSLFPGQGIFVATGDNPASSTVTATATFKNTEGKADYPKSSDNVSFTVLPNTKPELVDASDKDNIVSVSTVLSPTTVKTSLPSAPHAALRAEFEPTHTFDGVNAEHILVFKGKTQDGTPSWDIRSTIEFEATILDAELNLGDLLEWKTPAGTYGSEIKPWAVCEGKWTSGMDEADLAQRSVPLLNYVTGSGGTLDDEDISLNILQLTGSITLNMPEEGKLTYGSADEPVAEQGLSFIYTAKDLGGNELDFAVYVRTKKNEAPVFDDYDGSGSSYIFSSGDTEIKVGGWADRRPLERATTNWTIDWGADGGKTPANYKIADPDFGDYTTDETGLYVSLAVDTTPSITFPQQGLFVKHDDPIKLAWTTTQAQAGSKYNFKINAFDRFGYAAYPLNMKGVVYRYVRGAKVEKLIYRAEDPGDSAANPPIPARLEHIDRKDADFSTWASIQVDSFYYPPELNGSDADRLSGYMSEITDRIKGRHGHETDNSKFLWSTGSLPPGPYLVSADRIRGDATFGTTTDKTEAPVVGPAVTSTDMTTFDKYGHYPGVTAKDEDYWGSNYYTYAYINHSTPNLSTHAGSGRLAGIADKSLNDSKDGYGFDLNTYHTTDLLVPVKIDTANTDYTGRMNSIGNNLPTPNSDAIQFTFPSIGQSGFFDVAKKYDDVSYVYPVDKYGLSLGFTGKLGWAKNVADNPNVNGTNYNPIILDLNGTIQYTASKFDILQLSNMKKDTVVSWTMGGSTPPPFPSWRMVSTGKGDNAKISNGSVTDPPNPETNFSDVKLSDSRVFNATINRGSFREYLKQQVVWDNDDIDTAGGLYESVSDTLQVKAYVNGTSLGPDSHAGLPTLLEFGDLNSNPSGANQTGIKQFTNTMNLGPIRIPEPDTNWNVGAKTPVASYIATFQSPKGLPGSMGLITADMSGGISRKIAPVTNVKVTGVENWDAKTDLSAGEARNRRDAGVLVSGTKAGGLLNIDGTPVTAPIVAKAYKEDDKDPDEGYRPKVWLSWDPPANATSGADRISGYILEFFDSSSALTASSVPLYVVHLSPYYSEFPIPNNWSKKLGTNNKAVVRIRTVRYGSGNVWATVNNNIVTSGVVNFNETPFLKALPYAWAETITEEIKFPTTF